MSERWTAEQVPVEAYDRIRGQLKRAETLLQEVRNGKHSLPGTLVQIDRYFEQRGKDLDASPREPEFHRITQDDYPRPQDCHS